MRRLSSVILVAIMIFCISIDNVSTNSMLTADLPATSTVSMEKIDALLRAANTPETEIDAMSDELKLMIYENTLSQTKAEYIPVIREEAAGNMERSQYTISKSALKLSVSAFKVSGAEQVDVYPSYEWLIPVQPKGKDWLGYSTHDSYSCVSGKRSNLIWSKMESDDNWVKSHAADYTGSSMTGYQHYGSSLGTPDFELYLKGNFYYRVDIDSSSPVKKITLAYVHDTSSGSNPSYSVGYGPFSISITSNSSNVGYQNENFDLVY